MYCDALYSWIRVNRKMCVNNVCYFGMLWVGKRVYMSMEVYMDCACRLLGVCGFE